MSYDPFLRSDSFADKPWYIEFSMFLAIGVCQAQKKDVKEIREALARFLHATRTVPDFNKPDALLIIGDGAIDTDDVGAYIQGIRSE